VGDETVICPHIGGRSHTRETDGLIAALAARQHGVVARGQLLGLGVGQRAIERRIEKSRLHPLHPGVYAVGHKLLSQRGRWMAAVLACGPRAVLSHRSAAALWGIRPTDRSSIEITIPNQLRPRPGLHPHRAVLPPDEVTTHEGIPTTTPARTLLDLAAVTTRQTLERALDEAEILRLPGPAALLDRYPRRRGTKNLRALLLDARNPTPTRNDFEARFRTCVDDHGLPRPETNTLVEGKEVDAAWREAKLIIELDGFATHGTRRAFERDRRRDRQLHAAGWRVVRLTWTQLAEPELPAELAALLQDSPS
jgi:very-short-patch-repair endonuclease/predicted transcriptional regulator of viral defense system